MTESLDAQEPDERCRSSVVLVDVANVMGSRPDGWWKDRAAAATMLLARMVPLVGQSVTDPDGAPMRMERIIAVLEGASKAAPTPAGIEVVRAARDGDSTIVAIADRCIAMGAEVLVVTADRGLRGRLPERARVAGPGWFNPYVGR